MQPLSRATQPHKQQAHRCASWVTRSSAASIVPRRHVPQNPLLVPPLRSASKGDGDGHQMAPHTTSYSPMDSPPFHTMSFVDTARAPGTSYDSTTSHRTGHAQHSSFDGLAGQAAGGFGASAVPAPLHSRPESSSHTSSGSGMGVDGSSGSSFFSSSTGNDHSSHGISTSSASGQQPAVQEVEVVSLDGTTSISGASTFPVPTSADVSDSSASSPSAASAAAEQEAKRAASEAAVLAAVSHVNRLRGQESASLQRPALPTPPSQQSAGIAAGQDITFYSSGEYSEMYRARNTLQQSMQSASSISSSSAPSSASPTNGSSSLNSSNSAHNGGTSTRPSLPVSAQSEHQLNGDAAVAEALARAQSALNKATSSLDEISNLPSARPDGPFDRALNSLRSAAIVAGLITALLASHAFGLVGQWLGAAAGAAGIAVWGYRKGSLDSSGALAALFVGMGTLGCSLRLGATLLAFFFSSSKLTAYQEDHKEVLDESSKKGGQRDWMQVLSNGLVPTLLAIAYGVLAGCVDLPLGCSPQVETWRAQSVTALMGGFLGYYACCCGDTWASELGPLSADQPVLITTFRPVRKGTNGAVTVLGLLASILGGTFVGLVFYLAGVASPTLWVLDPVLRDLAIQQWKLIPLGLMAGLFGSVLDSVLGATVQFTGYSPKTGRVTSRSGEDVVHISGLPFLSNNGVNIASSVTTAALTAFVALKMFNC